MHPNCRSTTGPYYDESVLKNMKRRARNQEGVGKEIEYKNYREWEAELKARGLKPGGIKYLDEIERTKKLKEEFKKCNDILKYHSIKNFETYVEIRNDDEEYELFKHYIKVIESGDLSPFASFDLYKETNNEIINKLVGITTKNGIIITGRSFHFIDRIIGSSVHPKKESKRSGVNIDNVIKALTDKNVEIKPVKTNADGEKSQKFILPGVLSVSVNPDTKILIQAGPLRKLKEKRK